MLNPFKELTLFNSGQNPHVIIMLDVITLKNYKVKRENVMLGISKNVHVVI